MVWYKMFTVRKIKKNFFVEVINFTLFTFSQSNTRLGMSRLEIFLAKDKISAKKINTLNK